MAAHPFENSNELKMRLMPYRSRWPERDTNRGWTCLYEAADALSALITGLDAAARNIESDKDLAPGGVARRRAALASKALAELRDSRAVKLAFEAAERSIATIREHMVNLPGAPADKALAAEVRSFISKQKSPIDFAMSHLSDPLVLGAIISVPSFLSGLSDVEQAAVRLKAIMALHPEQQRGIELLEGAQAELRDGLTAARKLILERTDTEADEDGNVRPAHASVPTATVSGRSSVVATVGG